MNRVASGVLVLGLAALLAVACGGESSSEESGESHFLAFCESTCAEGFDCLCGACTARCSSADECAEHGSGAVCVPPSCGEGEPVCEVVCESNADCASLGAAHRCEGGVCRVGEPPAGNDGGAGPDGGNGGADGCAEGCQKVKIYPEVVDGKGGCIELDLDTVEVCACGELGLGRKCSKFVPDGLGGGGGASPDLPAIALYRVPAGVELYAWNQGEWTECSEEEAERVLHACEFSECVVKPPSACSVEDTCAQLGCGSLEFDEDGCRRTECDSDEECGEQERCVMTSLTSSFCDYSPAGDVCNCAGPAVDMTGSRCNPVSEVGPRGTWEKLELQAVQYDCSRDCVTIWTLTPDGAIEKATGDFLEDVEVTASSTLTEDELEQVRSLIDGAEIRPGARDGFGCGSSEDYEVFLELTLSGETYAQPIYACTFIDGHPVDQLAELVMIE